MAKKQAELPAVDTWPKVLAWLEERRDVWAQDHKSAREAAFWYVSYQEADCEGLSRKDIAWFFMHGLPKASVKSCKEWIAQQREEWNEGEEEQTDGSGAYDLRYELQEFWGVKS